MSVPHIISGNLVVVSSKSLKDYVYYRDCNIAFDLLMLFNGAFFPVNVAC